MKIIQIELPNEVDDVALHNLFDAYTALAHSATVELDPALKASVKVRVGTLFTSM